MFSAALEIVLTIAYREAVSRRHAYLTLEHLLYALAHDSEGERILQGCGADLPRLRKELNEYLDESVEQLKRGQEREPEQTAAFQRVLQTAVLHVQSAQRPEVQAGDILAAILQQPKSHAARLLESHGITRLDMLDFISHGISKVPQPDGDAAPASAATRTAGAGDEGSRHVARSARGLLPEPDRPRAARPARSAHRPRGRAAAHDRSALPAAQEQPGVRRRSRRRQDRDGRRPRHEAARPTTCRRCCKDAEVFSLDTGALLAGTRFRGDFEERFKAVIRALSRAAARDPLHRRDPLDRRRRRDHRRHDGSGDAHQADPHGRRPARHRIDDVRGVQAHREGPRAGAAAAEDRDRRAVDRRDRADPRRPARALRRAPRRDVHGRRARGRRQARRPASARLQAARQRDRRDRRSGRGDEAQESGCSRRPSANRRTPDHRRRTARTPVDRRRRRRHRGRRRAHGAHSRAPGVVVRSRAAAHARGIARARRLRPDGSRAPGRAVDQAIARGPRPARAAGGLLPVHRARPASARPSWRSSSRCSSATSSSAST